MIWRSDLVHNTQAVWLLSHSGGWLNFLWLRPFAGHLTGRVLLVDTVFLMKQGTSKLKLLRESVITHDRPDIFTPLRFLKVSLTVVRFPPSKTVWLDLKLARSVCSFSAIPKVCNASCVWKLSRTPFRSWHPQFRSPELGESVRQEMLPPAALRVWRTGELDGVASTHSNDWLIGNMMIQREQI